MTKIPDSRKTEGSKYKRVHGPAESATFKELPGSFAQLSFLQLCSEHSQMVTPGELQGSLGSAVFIPGSYVFSLQNN